MAALLASLFASLLFSVSGSRGSESLHHGGGYTSLTKLSVFLLCKKTFFHLKQKSLLKERQRESDMKMFFCSGGAFRSETVEVSDAKKRAREVKTEKRVRYKERRMKEMRYFCLHFRHVHKREMQCFFNALQSIYGDFFSMFLIWRAQVFITNTLDVPIGIVSLKDARHGKHFGSAECTFQVSKI